MHQKQNAENAADQSMPKRGLWESNEAAISPETMRRGCHASAHSAARAVRIVGPRFHSASQGLNAPGANPERTESSVSQQPLRYSQG
jgi:hypothetical protein